MKREIKITADGSSTIYLPDWNEQYHSKHGAIQEAYHVFIKNGLVNFEAEISILEIGFGTGLNAFITFLEAQKRKLTINYVGVEAYPVTLLEVSSLNYVEQLQAAQYKSIFNELHEIEWEQKKEISSTFSITKRKQLFKNITDENCFNLIYFDAFGAEHQPDLWTVEIFNLMYSALQENGIIVTYSAKGSVRRAMQEVGFIVERLPGPPGKREMLRGTKTI